MNPLVYSRKLRPWRNSTGLAAALAGFTLLGFGFPAARAAISIIETTDFSLSAFDPTVIPQPLGPGDNVVIGSLTGHDTTPDVDIFQLGNPLSLTLSSITVRYSNFLPSVPAHPATTRLMDPNSGGITADGDGLFVLPAVISDRSTLTFFMSGPGVGGSEFILAGSANYILTISAVPEPGGAALVVAAAMRARRRRGDSH